MRSQTRRSRILGGIPTHRHITQLFSDFVAAFSAISRKHKKTPQRSPYAIPCPTSCPPSALSDVARPNVHAEHSNISALQLPSATGGDGTPLAYSIIRGTFRTHGQRLASTRRHTHSQTGTFNVTFTVTDADGDTDTIEFHHHGQCC